MTQRMFLSAFLLLIFAQHQLHAAEKLVGIQSALVMAQSLPWIAQEAGLFRKYSLDFQLIYVASSPTVTGALLGGDAEVDDLVHAFTRIQEHASELRARPPEGPVSRR